MDIQNINIPMTYFLDIDRLPRQIINFKGSHKIGDGSGYYPEGIFSPLVNTQYKFLVRDYNNNKYRELFSFVTDYRKRAYFKINTCTCVDKYLYPSYHKTGADSYTSINASDKYPANEVTTPIVSKDLDTFLNTQTDGVAQYSSVFKIYTDWRLGDDNIDDYYIETINKVYPSTFHEVNIVRDSNNRYNLEIPVNSHFDKICYFTGDWQNLDKQEITKSPNDVYYVSQDDITNAKDNIFTFSEYSQREYNFVDPDRYWHEYYKTYISPTYVKYIIKKFDTPTVTFNNGILKWNISQTNFVQNGYDIYVDDIFYVNTSNTFVDLSQYKYGHHKFSVKVKDNTKTVNISDDEIIKYYEVNSKRNKLVDHTFETQHILIESDLGIYNYNGELDIPKLKRHLKTYVNKYKLEWYSTYGAENYEIKLDNEIIQATYTTTDIELTISQGPHSVEILAYYTIDNIKYTSTSPLKVQFNMDKIDYPRNINFSRNTGDSGNLTWSSVPEAEELDNVKEYTILINGNEINTNGNHYTLQNLPVGTSSVQLRSNFGPDTSYNSDYVEYSFTSNNIINKLKTPTLFATEIRDNETNGVIALRLSWDNISFASGYVVEETYEWLNDESGLWETEIIDDDKIDNEKIIKFAVQEGVGKHTYKVKAYFKELSNSYTSDWSNIPDKAKIEVSKLSPITGLKWKSNDTNKFRDQSTLLWSPVDNENYYRVFALKDGESGALDSKGYVIKADESLQYSFDILNMSVVNNQLTTANYDIYIRCYNYDTLYYQPSEISNKLVYDVIQLDAPTNVVFNSNTQTLSWTSVSNATSYIIYKVGESLPIAEVNETSYTFTDLGSGFHKFYVIAKRTIMEDE